MDIQEIRRQRLREWLKDRSAPAKEKSYFSQLLGGSSFGERAARRLERDYGMGEGFLDIEPNSATPEAPKKGETPPLFKGSARPSQVTITGTKFDKNVTPSPIGQRQIPVISYVQAGMMTEVVDPFALGEGLELITTDLELSDHAFGLIIEGNSMAPEFSEGDKVIIDPSLAPQPGDYVVAKNGHEEATFKKYRPRGTDEAGNMIFELVPLNDDYPTLNSQRDHMHVIGVMVEHRKYRRR